METRYSRNPQIARVLTEFGLVRELNERVKRIYADMKENNLEAPVYTENDQAVTLILKNNIEQRHLTPAIGDNGANVGANNENGANIGTNEQKIVEYIKINPTVSSSIISNDLSIALRTVQRILTTLQENGTIKNDGTRKKNAWTLLK